MLHKYIVLGDRHAPHNYEFADAAARTGATGFVTGDLQKLGLQLDDGTLWRLSGVSPVTWVQFGANGTNGADGAAGLDGANGLDGTNGTNGISVGVSRFTFTGALVTQAGVARWYPERDITIESVFFSLGAVSGSLQSINVKKNGVSIFPGAHPSVAAGLSLSSTSTVSVPLTTSDYLTVDIEYAGGQYLVGSIIYT